MEHGNNITIKVVNTLTNEVYDATIYQERKSSYLVHFKIGLLPFSKRTGKIFGKYMETNEIYQLQIKGA